MSQKMEKLNKWIVTRVKKEKMVVEARTINQAIVHATKSGFLEATTIESEIQGGAYYEHDDPDFFNTY